MTTTFFEENAVARRNTVTELCAAWRQSSDEIKQAFGLITAATNRLKHQFDGTRSGYYFDISRRGHSVDFENPDEAISEMRRHVWSCIVARLELRKLMSLKRCAEMDKQMETGEGLPEITVENVLSTLETNLANAGQYLEEKVFECYEMLRPMGWSLAEYKTNRKSNIAGVGRKVIRTYAVRRNRAFDCKYGFEVTYGRSQDELRALDQVFHMLDGKAQPNESWAGELCDAIRAQTTREKNTFETQYFRGRCFANGNLHLEFVRQDLLDKFNAIAGGKRINNVMQTP